MKTLEDFAQEHRLRYETLKMAGADAGPRTAYRILDHESHSKIIMDCLPDSHPDTHPGHKIANFVKIGKYLNSIGLITPEIYDVDAQNGFLLVEDFGDTHFKTAAQKGDINLFYRKATDVLLHMKTQANNYEHLELPNYYNSHVHDFRKFVVEWYLPVIKQAKAPATITQEYFQIWQDIEKELPPCPQGFCFIDYHFENLMYLPERKGMDQTGIIDYQGAMVGPAMYDLTNLLEDARVDVPADVQNEMLKLYTEGMSTEDKEIFESWYRIVATQFHCRVIGQFIMLAEKLNKTQYLEHIPRLERYIKNALSHPILKPLSLFFKEQGLTFDGSKPIELDNISKYVE